MSQYEKIDHLIFEVIKTGRSRLNFINRGGVLDEALRIASADGRDTDRIVDGRLQALRKRGLIIHVKGWGWRAKEAA